MRDQAVPAASGLEVHGDVGGVPNQWPFQVPNLEVLHLFGILEVYPLTLPWDLMLGTLHLGSWPSEKHGN